VVLDCEDGLVALASLPDSEFIVGALADKTCEFGMIKKKIMVFFCFVKHLFFDYTVPLTLATFNMCVLLFHPVPAEAGFKPLIMESLVNCSTNCVVAVGKT